MFLDRVTPALFAATLVAGCMADGDTLVDGGAATPDAGAVTNNNNSTNNNNNTGDRDGGVAPPPFAKSDRANLRFKRATRLRNDVAQALQLDPTNVCLELGQYHCTDFVHTISLGGVEPYTLGLNVPFDDTTVTTPIATERVALYACEARVGADLGGGSGVIFRDLSVDGEGKLADVAAEAVTQSLDTLYKRTLLRAPTDQELTHHRELYRAIEADGQPNAARDWAILSCFSVLTSMEGLFY